MPTRPPKHHPASWQSPAIRAQKIERDRGSPRKRGYDRTWEKLRLVILARDPLCVFCLASGQLTASLDVDHIQTIAVRPDLRLEPSNLRGLCRPCHSRLTAQQQARTRP